MVLVPKRTVLPIEGFIGGLNKDSDPTRLLPNELPEALNVNIGIRGEVMKRGGFVRHDTGLSNRIVAMMNWRDNAPTSAEWLVVIGEGGFISYGKDGSRPFNSSGVNIGAVYDTAAAWPVGFAAAKGNLYISSRRGETTKRWAGGSGSAWLEAPTVPKAQHLQWRFDQLFAANIIGSTSQLRVSYPLQPEDFSTEPAVFDFETDDGTEITALIPSGDDLMVFKDHSIHIFTGKVRSEFGKYRVDSLRGTVSPRTVKQVRGLIIFFDRDTGVWAWDGQQFTLISEKINNYILNNQVYGRAWMAGGHVRRDLYHLSLCWRGSPVPNRTFVFSTLTNAWTEWDIGWFDAARHDNKELIAGIKDLDGVYQGPVSWADDGVPFQVRVKTPWFTPGGAGAVSRLRRVESSMRSTGAKVTVNLRQEYATNPILSRSFTANNPTKDNDTDLIKNLDGWGRRADAHQLEYLTKDKLDFQLNAAQMIFTVSEDALGEHV